MTTIQYPLNFDSTRVFSCAPQIIQFPSREPMVTISFTKQYMPCSVTFLWNGVQSFLEFLMVCDTLKRNKQLPPLLIMPYFPGRMDRIEVAQIGQKATSRCSFNAAFFADMINNVGFDTVQVYDPHSDVTTALIKNCEPIVGDIPNLLVQSFKIGDFTLVSPDAGANKKIFKLAKALDTAELANIVRADKIRNVQTGEITGTEVFGDVDGKTCIIADDICSKGGTFIALAKKLKEKGASRIYLCVSHYEGTADESTLKDAGIERVYTSNSIVRDNDSSDFVVTLKHF